MRFLFLALTGLLAGGAALAQEGSDGGASMAERQEGQTICATLPWQKITPKGEEPWYRIDYSIEAAGKVPDLLRITLERHEAVATLRFFALVGRKEQRAFGSQKSVATFWTGVEVGPVPELVTPNSATPNGKVVGIYPRYVLPPEAATELSLRPIVRMTLGADSAISWELDPRVGAELKKAIACITGVSSAQESVVPDAEETSDLDALRPVLGAEP